MLAEAGCRARCRRRDSRRVTLGGYHLTFAAGTARARGPMRGQFLDELGGVQVLPESSAGAGGLEGTIDERLAGRPLDAHGERAAAARSTAWPWVAGAAVIALAAVF